MRQDKTGLEGTSRIGQTVTILNFSGPITREHLGKNGKKMRRDGTTQYPSGISRLVPNYDTFPGNLKLLKNIVVFLVMFVLKHYENLRVLVEF